MPGDAPCAAASITAPTDASTDELHAAVDDVPIGMLNVTLADSTTVVGGTDDREGVNEGVPDGDEVDESDALLVDVKDAESDAERESEAELDNDALELSDGDKDEELLTEREALIVELALAEGEVV